MNQPQFDALVRKVCAVDVTDPDTPLVDLGVDSLGHLALVMAVEERYGVEIDPDALADPALSTPSGLRRHVESLATV